MKLFSIRKATLNDLPAILNLYAQPEFDNGKILSVNETKEIFDKISHYPNYAIYVACDDESVIGTFALLIMDNIGHMGTPSGIVEDVAVDPAFQGKGVGKQMMKFAMEICAQHDCYKLTLSSNNKRIAAHEFYKSLGFKQHGISFHVNLND